MYPIYAAIYTDGSLINTLTGCAFVWNDRVSRLQQYNLSNIYIAELYTVHGELLCISHRTWKHFLICFLAHMFDHPITA